MSSAFGQIHLIVHPTPLSIENQLGPSMPGRKSAAATRVRAHARLRRLSPSGCGGAPPPPPLMSARVSHRTCKNGHLSKLTKKCEAVPGSRIRNQVPQFVQLKKEASTGKVGHSGSRQGNASRGKRD